MTQSRSEEVVLTGRDEVLAAMAVRRSLQAELIGAERSAVTKRRGK